MKAIKMSLTLSTQSQGSVASNTHTHRWSSSRPSNIKALEKGTKMKHLRKTLLLAVVCLGGCATNVTMTGKAYPPVSRDQVKILFHDKPKCSYEELAFISTPLMWNQNAAMKAAREKAAEVGADYLVISTVNKNGYNDASVSGIAYKCGDVDRHRVKVDQDNK